MSSITPDDATASLIAKKNSSNFKKRQEDAKKKQSGELPPDLDQDGKMINPHNPDFITKVPWYLGESGPTLKHHNVQKVDHFLSMAETDALVKKKLLEKKNIVKATGYRKGACKNCGAMTHKEKDCVERPRSSRRAAWKSGIDIAEDEVSLRLEDHGKISYDAKRDQWQGYDPVAYKNTIEKYQRIDSERRKLKQEQKELRRRAEEEKQKKKLEAKESKLKRKETDATRGTSDVPSSGLGGEVGSDETDPKDKTTESDSGSDSDSDSEYDSDEDVSLEPLSL